MSTAELDSAPAAQAPLTETTAGDKTTYPEWYNQVCADLSQLPSTGGGDRLDGMRAVLTRASWMWDNGQVLTCAFVEPAGDAIQQAKVISVAKEWERYANLKLDFESARESPLDATIRISFDQGLGSWSTVGKIAFHPDLVGQATMNFGWVYNCTTEATAKERGVILHEFGHAVGYLHEHQSPRRGDKLKLKEQEAIKYFWDTQNPPWDAEKTRRNFLNVYNKAEVSNYSSVDLTSVMMYFMPPELNEQGIDIPPNYELDALDKAFAFLNYPFIGGLTSSDASHTLDNALNTIGVTGRFRQSITAEFNENDWKGVRAEFTRWTLNARAEAIKKEAVAEREAEAEAGVQS
ncbi:hypothetical protein EST38_g11201 [Candolleomyces aberdarensis]|uniref:Peptidase metallopeptidase domain-containing protein n=1 Tax=Candolleomyces aberdarensis TaxID=2316362 RepID=A0A4Q2D5F8_9AGAR|nr:hypothetical protein EST38_g11201 [Candolleomyces aberdarensis]